MKTIPDIPQSRFLLPAFKFYFPIHHPSGTRHWEGLSWKTENQDQKKANCLNKQFEYFAFNCWWLLTPGKNSHSLLNRLSVLFGKPWNCWQFGKPQSSGKKNSFKLALHFHGDNERHSYNWFILTSDNVAHFLHINTLNPLFTRTKI